MVAVRGLHDAAALPGCEAPARAVEGRHELAPRRGREVTGIAGGLRVLGDAARELAETGAAIELGDRAFRLAARGGPLLRRRGLRHREEHVLEDPEAVAVVEAVELLRAEGGAAGDQRIVPAVAADLGDVGPERLGDRRGVGREPVPGDGLGEERVVHPHPGDEVGRLAVEAHALRPGQDLRQPLGRERQLACIRGRFRVRGEEIAKVRAPRDRERSHHQPQSPHANSRDR